MKKTDQNDKAAHVAGHRPRSLLILLAGGEYTDVKGKTTRTLSCAALRPRPLSEFDMTGDVPPKGRGFACKMEKVRLVLAAGDMVPDWALDRNKYPAFVSFPADAVPTVRGGDLSYEVRAADLQHFAMSPPSEFHPPVVGDHPDS